MFRTGDVVKVIIPNAIGSQQSGERYGVIISNNIGNANSPMVEILPSTTKRNGKQPTHAFFKAGEIPGLKYDTVFLAENKWPINKFQIKEVVAHLTDEQMERVAEAMLFATPCIIAAIKKGVHETDRFKYVASV